MMASVKNDSVSATSRRVADQTAPASNRKKIPMTISTELRKRPPRRSTSGIAMMKMKTAPRMMTNCVEMLVGGIMRLKIDAIITRATNPNNMTWRRAAIRRLTGSCMGRSYNQACQWGAGVLFFISMFVSYKYESFRNNKESGEFYDPTPYPYSSGLFGLIKYLIKPDRSSNQKVF